MMCAATIDDRARHPGSVSGFLKQCAIDYNSRFDNAMDIADLDNKQSKYDTVPGIILSN